VDQHFAAELRFPRAVLVGFVPVAEPGDLVRPRTRNPRRTRTPDPGTGSAPGGRGGTSTGPGCGAGCPRQCSPRGCGTDSPGPPGPPTCGRTATPCTRGSTGRRPGVGPSHTPLGRGARPPCHPRRERPGRPGRGGRAGTGSGRTPAWATWPPTRPGGSWRRAPGRGQPSAGRWRRSAGRSSGWRPR
jgi:hypothetical protein